MCIRDRLRCCPDTSPDHVGRADRGLVRVFLADLLLRRTTYAEPDLYDSAGRYGAVNSVAVGGLILGTGSRWGLVVNTFAAGLSWQGYLLEPFGLGPRLDGPWTYANLGVLVAFVIGFASTYVLGRSRVRAQEDAAVNARS